MWFIGVLLAVLLLITYVPAVPMAPGRFLLSMTSDRSAVACEASMYDLPLSAAQTILAAALAEARRLDLKPLIAFVVLDARGAVKAAAVEDGTSLRRFEVAQGKAYGAIALGIGSRAVANRAVEQPSFVAAASHVVGGALVPAPGGVLIRAEDGRIVGAVGISGDTSDNDEACAKTGIEAAGLTAETG